MQRSERSERNSRTVRVLKSNVCVCWSPEGVLKWTLYGVTLAVCACLLCRVGKPSMSQNCCIDGTTQCNSIHTLCKGCGR